ncbi:CD276 antigen homolog [Scleropages formosus]|uniref:CD276 antigen homolog n=1 Tax=Scleropages formosus TaxID=113540 RepID=A0A8C9TQL2_SCLFO|nr:CD276 antigen homolog [Scleropages formosus]XP_018598758.1 CD276 antigen homolog [Scleropages formosus]XP_018598759.1 CD276 antigen homolog [Scleropages formosus]XP_029113676.1 CD276 antigen homolog [Scleropages formosus]
MALMKGGFIFTALIIGCMTAATTGTMVGNSTVNATLGQSVTLPCVYNPNAPLDKHSMRIYWQYQAGKDPIAMKMYNKGVMEMGTHINKKYQDKAKVAVEELEKGNFNLTLDAVEHSDQGTYQTVFMYNDKKVLECTNWVHVGAEFSKPEVSVVSCVTSVEKVKEVEVTCRTRGGFPRPSIRWSSGNCSADQEADDKIKESSQNKTFVVRSRLTVNASVGQKYTCSIFNPTLGTTQENSVTVLQCLVPKPFPTTICVIMVAVVVVAAMLFVFFACRKKNANRPREGTTAAAASAAGYDLETQKLQGNGNYGNHTDEHDSKIL